MRVVSNGAIGNAAYPIFVQAQGRAAGLESLGIATRRAAASNTMVVLCKHHCKFERCARLKLRGGRLSRYSEQPHCKTGAADGEPPPVQLLALGSSSGLPLGRWLPLLGVWPLKKAKLFQPRFIDLSRSSLLSFDLNLSSPLLRSVGPTPSGERSM